MAAGYIIQVGNEKPQEAIVAQPNKRGEPTGDQFKRYMRVGSHLIMNRARVWGVRVIGDKKKMDDGRPIAFDTVGYTGELEFLPWEHNDGLLIDIRYDPVCRSLDFDYQEKRLRLDVSSEKAMAQIILNTGQNKYDTKKGALLIQFLKVVPSNRDSKSKNPNPEVKGYTFYEMTDDHVDSVSIKKRESNIDAGNIVKGLSNNPQKLRNLFDIMGQREEFGDTNRLSSDLQIYKVMLEYSESNPEDFFSLITEYKKGVMDNFDKAKSYKALDLTKDGHIAFLNGQKAEVLISGIKAKGEKMIDYMIENYLEDEVYRATDIFKQLANKLN